VSGVPPRHPDERDSQQQNHVRQDHLGGGAGRGRGGSSSNGGRGGSSSDSIAVNAAAALAAGTIETDLRNQTALAAEMAT